MPIQPNIPNTNQKTVRAYMKVKSFVSPSSPTPEQVAEYDKDVINFLETIDNVKRFLNGRNSYSLGDKLYILIWYLESVADEPVTQPFGGKATPVTIKPEEKKDEQPNTPPQA